MLTGFAIADVPPITVAAAVSATPINLQLTEMVLGSPAVPARKEERVAVQPLLDAFLDGLRSHADEVLLANLDRAGARLVRLVSEEQRRFIAKPSYQQVVRVEEFAPTRSADKKTTAGRYGPFSAPCSRHPG